MLRTTAVSLLALATITLPAGAQTVLYGDTPPPPATLFPQPQPYFPNQPVQQPQVTQPLYYESTPSAPPPPVIYQPEQEARQFRPITEGGTVQQGVIQTRPFAPAERFVPTPPPVRQDEIVSPPPRQPRIRTEQPPAPPMIARPEPRPAPGSAMPVEAVRAPISDPALPQVSESEALRDFSAELSRIVALGERYRAASPGFLEDLRSLAGKYEDMPVRIETPDAPEQAELVGPPPPATPPAPSPEVMPEEAEPPVMQTMTPDEEPEMAMVTPAEQMSEPEPAMVVEPEPEPQELPQALPPTSAAIVYLRDDFADGEYLSNPSWNVRQGRFTIDPAYGLRPFVAEAATPAQVTPQALLQYLIGEGKPETPAAATGDSGASLIEAQTDIGNSFSMVTTITDHSGEGAAHFIMHQGGANWLGYRLELRAGPRPLVVLARRGSSGYKDIMKVEAPAFTTGTPHQLRWARLSDGQMFVLIDGRPVITARDTVFQQGWKGFAYFTADADVSMRNIRIAEPVER